jgi:hypothetical protein
MTVLVANKAMVTAGASSTALRSVGLPDWIRRIDFVSAEGCFFIAHLYRNRGNLTLAVCHDETGYECSVNHFHIDGHPCGDPFGLGLALCTAIGERWQQCAYGFMPLRQIVSCDEASCAYRCHVIRQGQAWLVPDLDTYPEAILAMEVPAREAPPQT